MKEYEFITVYINWFFGAKSDEHREIIKSQAKKGWRYVGYIPTRIAEEGKIKEMDLVFEKDVEAEM